jgi:hypothetical protein
MQRTGQVATQADGFPIVLWRNRDPGYSSVLDRHR